MANLYQIDRAILDCIDKETGEIVDCEALEALLMQKDEKIENVACWIKNLLSDADAIKAEKDNLAEREARCRKQAESLKKYLSDILRGSKFSTAKCAVSFRKSVKVEVENVNLVPAEYLRVKTTYEPDKTAIKKAMQAEQEIAGCKLVESLNVQIK